MRFRPAVPTVFRRCVRGMPARQRGRLRAVQHSTRPQPAVRNLAARQRRVGASPRGGDMARLLDAVTPLADLVARTPDPGATVTSIRAACSDGTTAVLRVMRETASAAGIDARLMTLAAAH